MANLFQDPAARTLIAAALLKRVKSDKKAAPLAAAFGINGELAIVPAVIAMSRAAQEEREESGKPAPTDRSDLDAKEKQLEAEKARLAAARVALANAEANRAARLRKEAKEHLDRCLDRFLVAIRSLDPEEKPPPDLIAKIKEAERLLEEATASAAAAQAPTSGSTQSAASAGAGSEEDGSSSSAAGAKPAAPKK